MKVLAINGSPRKDGNTAQALNLMVQELNKENIEVEIINIGDHVIRGCISCYYCTKNEEKLCANNDDAVNETARKLRKADGVILAAPTYYGGIAGTMKAFLDRLFYINKGFLNFKVSTAITIARRSGGVDVLHQLHNYLMLSGTIQAPCQYWLIAHGRQPGESMLDTEGVVCIQKNAMAMAWLLKIINAGKEEIPPPVYSADVKTNFIR